MTDNRTTELLPCPFCGDTPFYPQGYVSCIICPTCQAYGPGHSDMTSEQLVEAWNTRTPEQAVAATLGSRTLTAEQVRKARIEELEGGE